MNQIKYYLQNHLKGYKKMFCILISTIFFTFFSTQLSFAQTLNENWWVPNGTVYSVLSDSTSNTLYLGGEFNYLGPNAPYGAQLDAATGMPDLPFAKPNGAVNTVIPDGSGGWYIGGAFTSVQGQTRNRLARINADGSLHSWNPDANGSVNSLHMNHGVVYAAGAFTILSGLERGNIGAIDPETGMPADWIGDSPNNFVNTITSDENNVYIGGNFTRTGGIVYNYGGASIDAATGMPDLAFARPNETVYTVIPDGSGGWYIGGAFTSVQGQTRNRLARINADGTLHPWNPDVNYNVYSILLSGNTVYIGGSFTSIGGQSRNRVGAINATTGVPTNWNPNANGEVSDLAISGSTLYAAGYFTTIGGQTRNYIAALSTSTGNATSWNPNPNYGVEDLEISGSTIYAAGAFTTIGGQTRNNIAALNNTTGAATTWNPNANGNVNSLAINGTTLYAGGQFTTIGGQTRNRIAALSTSTGNASSWNPNANGIVSSLTFTGSTLYAGGSFSTIGGQSRNRLAAINTSTGLATAWNPDPTALVISIAATNLKVYIGGSLQYFGGQTRNYIAALNHVSGITSPWNPNATNRVESLAISDNILYAGGSFTNIGGQARNRIAALDLTSGNATSWNPNANSSVVSLFVEGAILYAGGNFSTIGGQPRNRIAAIDKTTGLATSWNPNANSGVRSVFVNGNSIYAGGIFTSIGGQPRRYLAQLDISTGNATSWDPNPSDVVLSIFFTGDKIFTGGNFRDIGGVTRNCLAAIDLNTGKATNWNPNGNDMVLTMVNMGSTLYIGGRFTTIGGQARNRIAALDMVTGLPTAWNSNANNSVNSIIVNGSTLYAGGSFTTIGGQSRNNIAALDINTGLANSWNPGVGSAGSYVFAMATSGNTLYIGGSFTQFGGLSRDRLAAVNLLDGTTTSWNPGADNDVYAIKPIGNIVYTGGSFTQTGGMARDRIAALDKVTGVPTSWNPPAFNVGNPNVKTIEIAGSLVIIGGTFNSLGGETRQNFAVLDISTAGLMPWNSSFLDPYELGINDICLSGNRVFVGGGFEEINGIQQARLGSFDINETFWQGNISQDFNHPQNWSFGKADRFPNSRIRSGLTQYPRIDNDPAQAAVSNSLTIDAGASLTIEAGKAFTVNGTLVNNGTLTLESDAAGTASLIHNTSDVPATVERYIDGGWDEWNSGWHQVSSPVSGQSITAFETSGSGNGFDFYGWDEPTAVWRNYKTPDFALWNGGTNDFVTARGYLISYEQTQTGKSFNGIVHTNDVVLTGLTQSAGSHSGWHMLGNPFASAVRWNDGNWALNNVAGIAKVWSEPNNSYLDISANELIPSAQGFMVQVTGPANGLTIPSASRVHSAANLQKYGEAIQKLVLQVSDAEGKTAQESRIAIHTEATTYFDYEYDARFLPGYAPLFYSVAGDEMLSTNTQPALESNTVIPLGFVKNAASDYRISLNAGIDGLITYLTDKKTNIVTNLSQTPAYNFSAEEGDDADRFLLHFGTVGMEDPEEVKPVKVYTSDGVTYLEGVKAGADITFTSLTGQTVIRATATEGLNTFRTSHLSAGIYLIRVADTGVISVHKIVIR